MFLTRAARLRAQNAPSAKSAMSHTGNWPHIRAAKLRAQNAPSAKSAINHMGNWPHIRAARLHAQNAPSARSAISHMGNRPHIPAAPNFPPAPQAEPVKNAARNTAFSVICGQRGCSLATARTAAVACAAAQLIPQTVPVAQEPAFRGLCASIAVRNMAIYIRTSLKHLNDRLPVGRKDLNTHAVLQKDATTGRPI